MIASDRPIVTRGCREGTGTSQSGGLAFVTGVGPQHTPATRLWFGKASNKPGVRSLPHHHAGFDPCGISRGSAMKEVGGKASDGRTSTKYAWTYA
jgi:hypothetical protein